MWKYGEGQSSGGLGGSRGRFLISVRGDGEGNLDGEVMMLHEEI